MAFIVVNKDKVKNKGIVYLLQVGDAVTITTNQTNKLDAILDTARKFYSKGRVPEIKVLRSKKVKDRFYLESRLNGTLYDYRMDSKSSIDKYSIEKEDLYSVWGLLVGDKK